MHAHEVTRNQQETVDARLPSPAPKDEKKLIAGDVVIVVQVRHPTMVNVVVGYNHEHQEDPEQFDIGVSNFFYCRHRFTGWFL